MTDTIVRLKVGKSLFETRIDADLGLKLRKGEAVAISSVIRDNAIYSDINKGMRSSSAELANAFGSTDLNVIVDRMVKKGEIEIPKEIRDEALEAKKKQVIDFLTKNAIDSRTNRPYTADMISNAMKQAGVKVENVSIDKQIKNIIDALKKILPIKIETKKILLRVPPEFTGRVYGIVQEYKEKEEWLSNGSLELILNIPVGLQSEFYDKLNSITHGSAITSEIKE
ncbi:MAG: ribosome assembly factor SBDS [Candidatus Nanoarchaeia archaeon]